MAEIVEPDERFEAGASPCADVADGRLVTVVRLGLELGLTR